jgi:hypothetical protein
LPGYVGYQFAKLRHRMGPGLALDRLARAANDNVNH